MIRSSRSRVESVFWIRQGEGRSKERKRGEGRAKEGGQSRKTFSITSSRLPTQISRLTASLTLSLPIPKEIAPPPLRPFQTCKRCPRCELNFAAKVKTHNQYPDSYPIGKTSESCALNANSEPNKRSISSHKTKHDKISRLDGMGNGVC